MESVLELKDSFQEYAQRMLEEQPYKAYVLLFAFTVYIWETYLSYRQHRNLKLDKVPTTLVKVVKKEEFKKANTYGLDKSYFGFISSAFAQAQMTVVFCYDLLPWFWKVSADVMLAAGFGLDWEIVHSLVFFVLTSVSSSLVNLPFSLFQTFVIEQKHGFNKQTLGLFFSDFIKGMVVAGMIGLPFLAGFLQIIKYTGDAFFFYIWIFMLAFQFFLITIYPTVIQPLFNKFTPLEEGELKKKINALAERVKFPLTKVFVIDGSKRSSHSNAYFYGFFKNKRIVLFDTLIEQTTQEEICGVLAHELGHWAHNHVFRTLIVTQIHLFVIFYLFSHFVHFKPLYESFGFYESKPILIGFLLFQYIYLPVESIMTFMMNLLSRYHEFQADRYAKNLGYAKVLCSGLIKLHLKNLGSMNPDSWYSAWHYSHPPLVERLDAIGQKTE